MPISVPAARNRHFVRVVWADARRVKAKMSREICVIHTENSCCIVIRNRYRRDCQKRMPAVAVVASTTKKSQSQNGNITQWCG